MGSRCCGLSGSNRHSNRVIGDNAGGVTDVAMADDMAIIDLTTAEDIDTVSDLCDKTNVTGHAIIVDKAVKTIVVTSAS